MKTIPLEKILTDPKMNEHIEKFQEAFGLDEKLSLALQNLSLAVFNGINAEGTKHVTDACRAAWQFLDKDEKGRSFKKTLIAKYGETGTAELMVAEFSFLQHLMKIIAQNNPLAAMMFQQH